MVLNLWWLLTLLITTCTFGFSTCSHVLLNAKTWMKNFTSPKLVGIAVVMDLRIVFKKDILRTNNGLESTHSFHSMGNENFVCLFREQTFIKVWITVSRVIGYFPHSTEAAKGEVTRSWCFPFLNVSEFYVQEKDLCIIVGMLFLHAGRTFISPCTRSKKGSKACPYFLLFCLVDLVVFHK